MIEFVDIQVKYGDTVVINNLNLTINEGEFFTLLGPSGCGKTTTLRSLVGFLDPSKGSILVNGKDVTNVPVEKRNIGIVFQSYALFPTMTVYDNISFGLKVKKLEKAKIAEMVYSIADVIDLSEDQLFRNVSELSGGQQQRVALARAIILQPEILCLDEPLSNLDAKLRVGLRSELKRLQRDLGITTVYVTHDQEEALTLSDRIGVFNEGNIEQVGSPYEIYNHSASEFVCNFIGEINRFDRKLISAVARQSQKPVKEDKTGFIRIERINLHRTEKCDVKLTGTITDREYNGIHTKYSFVVLGEKIKCVEKNDGINYYDLGTEHHLFFDSNDIMQF